MNWFKILGLCLTMTWCSPLVAQSALAPADNPASKNLCPQGATSSWGGACALAQVESHKDWTLIVLSSAGNVSSSFYTTKALCEEAAFIAENGMTRAEKTEKEEAAKRSNAEREAKWKKEHPPREPKDDREREMVQRWLKAKQDKALGKSDALSWVGTITSSGAFSLTYPSVNDDGLIEDMPSIVTGSLIASTGPSVYVKYTKCFRSESEPAK